MSLVKQVATKLSLAAKGNVVTLHLPGTDCVPEVCNGSHYKELPLEALLTEIRDSVAAMDAARGVIDREMRARLLPALLALKARTKRQKPGYYDHLRAMGLTPGRVKMWFFRANAGQEIEALVEEPQPEPPAREREIGAAGDEQDGEEILLEAADRLAKSVLEGKLTYAKRLAKEWVEARKLL
jgi:hypothetical protein